MKKLSDVINQIPNLKDVNPEYKGKCKRCGNDTYELDGVKIGCVCEIYDKSLEDIKRSRVNDMDRASIINKSYRTKKLNGINKLSDDHTKAIDIAKDYIIDFETHLVNGHSLMLQGDIGTGKTHIAAAIRNELVARNYKVFFISVPEYIESIKKRFDDKTAFEHVERMSKDADLLIVDDIGANRMTEFAIEELFKLVDARTGKCNIFTTNLSSKELNKNLDLKRVFSRMMEDTKLVTIKGQDYRLRNF